MRAIEPRTGDIKWEFKYYSAPSAGTLSTARGLVFAADGDGNLIAFNARSGKELWHMQTGAHIAPSPLSYAIDGRQRIVIPSGGALFVFGLPANAIGQEVSQSR